MLDQATRLRELAAAYRAQASGAKPTRRTKVLAVTSGKGGVGKSNMSINLAHALMAAGKEVILLDADLGLANVDILLGVVPQYHLGHLLNGERTITELIYRTKTNLQIIAGGTGLSELVNLGEAEIRLFVDGLAQLSGRCDYLILDTGAGLSTTVQEFAMAADQVLVVTTPEPTSLADAYGAIKTLARRRPNVDVKLVVNQVERGKEAEWAVERIVSTARNFLELTVEHLGTVPRDPAVWEAVRQQTPFCISFPSSPAAVAVVGMARKLIRGDAAPEPEQKPKSGFFDRLTGLFGRQNSDAM